MSEMYILLKVNEANPRAGVESPLTPNQLIAEVFTRYEEAVAVGIELVESANATAVVIMRAVGVISEELPTMASTKYERF